MLKIEEMQIENKVFILTIRTGCFELLLFPVQRESNDLTLALFGMTIDSDMFLILIFGQRIEFPPFVFWVVVLLVCILVINNI